MTFPTQVLLSALSFCALCLVSPVTAAGAGPLEGKSYIIELSSSQSSSGYGDYLLPPLIEVLARSEMTAGNGPDADVVVNVVTHSDVGQWTGQGDDRAWIHSFDITVGISAESYLFPIDGTPIDGTPIDGTPVFDIRARLLPPNSDREDERVCLIKLAARTALAEYRASGIFQTDGSSCLRKPG